ncbi:M48 family metallopeptidase [Salinarimonas soli]|uniref:M48 family metallopeptidase n=1 Tax=Salinarimonas soli TaxID=1638099 RepID=A0A5B2V3J7_9HYPH|nr:SprT family zinc-dependent metalloprotease [Salinarimonas soli]KAA2233441.1 M48 family metallopeptidase [Salinarimonas soli]
MTLSRFALFRRPDPTDITVAHEGAIFRVALRRRPAARRLTLRVSSVTGEAVLTIPERTDVAAAKRFADAHGGWIAARLARVPDRVALVPGALVPLRGVEHRIAHRPVALRRVSVATDAGGPILAVAGETAEVAGRVRAFLQREARRDLEAAVARYAEALGVSPSRITLRDTTSRWGSCSARGGLNFSWRLILAPPFVLDYLAAHEVAHLREMNHSQRFWRLVQGACPATQEAEAWLKRHGAGLHRYG